MSRRLLFVCNDANYFAQHRLHVARSMRAEDWQVRLAVGGDLEHVPRGFDARYIDVHRKSFKATSDWRLSRQIRRAVVDFCPDVVHLITMKPIVFGGLGLLYPQLRDAYPKRIVATFPGLGRVFESNTRSGVFNRALVVRVLSAIFRRLPAIATFENRRDRNTMVSLGILTEAQTRVIAGAGLDLSQFVPLARQGDGQPFRALWASRLIRGKGLAEFVEAARLGSGSPGVEFLVAGYPDPGHEDSLSSDEIVRIQADPAIRYLGYVADMAALLRKVDALVLPSRYNEGLPRSLIEAAASGLPGIASDNAGCRAVVRHGETGLLLSDISAGSILEAVQRLASDRPWAAALGQAAAAYVRTNGFSNEAVQEAFRSCYEAG